MSKWVSSYNLALCSPFRTLFELRFIILMVCHTLFFFTFRLFSRYVVVKLKCAEIYTKKNWINLLCFFVPVFAGLLLKRNGWSGLFYFFGIRMFDCSVFDVEIYTQYRACLYWWISIGREICVDKWQLIRATAIEECDTVMK